MNSLKKNRCVFNKHTLIIIVIAVILIFPLTIYFIKFGGGILSDDPADWGVFGDYVGGVYSILVTVLAIYLARALGKKDEKQKKSVIAAEQLYQQIQTIENSNNRNSITKLQRDIRKNELYISDDLKNDLVKLADEFLEENDGNGAVDIDLKASVLDELKKLYNV